MASLRTQANAPTVRIPTETTCITEPLGEPLRIGMPDSQELDEVTQPGAAFEVTESENAHLQSLFEKFADPNSAFARFGQPNHIDDYGPGDLIRLSNPIDGNAGPLLATVAEFRAKGNEISVIVDFGSPLDDAGHSQFEYSLQRLEYEIGNLNPLKIDSVLTDVPTECVFPNLRTATSGTLEVSCSETGQIVGAFFLENADVPTLLNSTQIESVARKLRQKVKAPQNLVVSNRDHSNVLLSGLNMCFTDQGHRDYQEDAAMAFSFVLPNGENVTFVGVADQAGGHNSGGIQVSDRLLDGIRRAIMTKEGQELFQNDPTRFVNAIVAQIHARIQYASLRREALKTSRQAVAPASTLAMVWRIGNSFLPMTIGDATPLFLPIRKNQAGPFGVSGGARFAAPNDITTRQFVDPDYLDPRSDDADRLGPLLFSEATALRLDSAQAAQMSTVGSAINAAVGHGHTAPLVCAPNAPWRLKNDPNIIGCIYGATSDGVMGMFDHDAHATKGRIAKSVETLHQIAAKKFRNLFAFGEAVLQKVEEKNETPIDSSTEACVGSGDNASGAFSVFMLER